MDDETVAWEGFRGAGLISEDGVRRGVGVSGREVAGAGAGVWWWPSGDRGVDEGEWLA